MKHLERPRDQWEDDVKRDLKETGCKSLDWIHVAQNRDWWQSLLNMVLDFQVS
jgi:hypothetical protein